MAMATALYRKALEKEAVRIMRRIDPDYVLSDREAGIIRKRYGNGLCAAVVALFNDPEAGTLLSLDYFGRSTNSLDLGRYSKPERSYRDIADELGVSSETVRLTAIKAMHKIALAREYGPRFIRKLMPLLDPGMLSAHKSYVESRLMAAHAVMDFRFRAEQSGRRTALSRSLHASGALSSREREYFEELLRDGQ